ncbi:efflux RND transporter periplasmic adaptor subunit [Celeribacter sp.]|uniref:efflux RND transporter periplasmic adaptor subunit n=1 Tax=Celeribacter sp. TaxID=1890673 RepID=UPI003A92C955
MSTITASAVLLGIEKSIRQARDMTALQFVAVTETRRLISYQQAVLLSYGVGGKLRVVAVSNVPSVDRNAPYIRFVEKLANRDGPSDQKRVLSRTVDARGDDAEWREFLQDSILCQPVLAPDGTPLGLLLLVRAKEWLDEEILLIEQLTDALGHAWNALRPRKKRGGLFEAGKKRRVVLVGGLIAIIAVLCIPVRQSIIAPATVIPRDPVMIAAPITGVIREIRVRPNAPVAKDDLLFSFEGAEFRANYEISLRAVDTAEAELRRASQQAFGDAKGRAEVALSQTRLALRQEQAKFSRYQLSQVDVRAPQSGIAIFSDPNDWRGRPVSTGEQVMAIAAPAAAELGISIPVADAITLQSGAEVRLFLDVDPLGSIGATLEYTAYQPKETPDGILAYRAVARFDNPEDIPRIGLRGSAKIMGDRVPLALFLFRRPLAALRQMIGF